MKPTRQMSITAAMGLWLDAESESFTAMCGESITRREVIQTAAGIILLATAICCAVHISDFIASWLAGGEI